MEKLLTWYNPKSGAYHSKWVRNSNFNIGDINQFGHVLCEEIFYDYYLEKYVCSDYKKTPYKKKLEYQRKMYRANKRFFLRNQFLALVYKEKKNKR